MLERATTSCRRARKSEVELSTSWLDATKSPDRAQPRSPRSLRASCMSFTTETTAHSISQGSTIMIMRTGRTDGDSLAVDSREVSVFEERDEVGL